MKVLHTGPAASQQAQNLFAGIQIAFVATGNGVGVEAYWENTTGRAVRISVALEIGVLMFGLQPNTQTLTLTPNISPNSSYNLDNDMPANKVEWVHNSSDVTKVQIHNLYVPSSEFLILTLESSDAGDTSVNMGGSKVVVVDISPGDIDYIKGVLAASTGTAGLLDVNVVESGGSTPLSEPLSANITQLGGNTSAGNNIKLQYNTVGLTGATFPSTQSALNNITGAGSPRLR
jgi:hypothetical protein